MKVLNHLNIDSDCPSCVTIGKFDGVHRGHQELVRRTVEEARALSGDGPCKAVLIAFDSQEKTILTKKERRDMLESMGIDLLVECPLDPLLFHMEAETFARDILAGHFHARRVVVGEDFHFGYGRRGTPELLSRIGAQCGFTADPVPDLMDGLQKISSTVIREEICSGHMERVRELLGYPYYVSGDVVQGNHKGRTIGIPTANIIPDEEKLLPPFGVYTSVANIDGREVFGMTDVGTKPTVGGTMTGVETHFHDFKGEIYGRFLRVSMLHFTRPEKKFASFDELHAQLLKDRRESRDFFHLDD